MDEEFYYADAPATDVMVQRCEAICALAEVADQVKTKKVQTLVINALEAMVWSITPPRGEVVAFKPAFPTSKLGTNSGETGFNG